MTRERELEALLYTIFIKYPDGIEINKRDIEMFSYPDLDLHVTENYQRGTVIIYNKNNDKR